MILPVIAILLLGFGTSKTFEHNKAPMKISEDARNEVRCTALADAIYREHRQYADMEKAYPTDAAYCGDSDSAVCEQAEIEHCIIEGIDI